MNNKTPILQLNRFDALTGVADENLSRQIARRHAGDRFGAVLSTTDRHGVGLRSLDGGLRRQPLSGYV